MSTRRYGKDCWIAAEVHELLVIRFATMARGLKAERTTACRGGGLRSTYRVVWEAQMSNGEAGPRVVLWQISPTRTEPVGRSEPSPISLVRAVLSGEPKLLHLSQDGCDSIDDRPSLQFRYEKAVRDL